MFYYIALAFHLILTPFFWKLFATALLGFVSLIAVYVFYQHWRYDAIPGPPRGSFWLGHFASLYECLEANNVLSSYLYNNVKKFGHTVRFFMFHRPFVVVVDPGAVEDILTPGKHELCTTTCKMEGEIFGARWQGSGLFTDCNDERLKVRRDTYEHIFQKDYIKARLPDINAVVDRIIDHFYELGDGKTLLSLSDQFERAMLDILCKVFFGKDVDSTPCQRDPFKAAIFQLLSARRKEKTDPWTNISLWKRNLRISTREACALLRKTGRLWIEERKQKQTSGEAVPNDVLSALIEFSNKPGISYDDVLDDFMVFLVGTLEHAPKVLAFLVRESTKNPQIYKRLVEEIDTEMAGKSDIESSTLDRLAYMEAVLRETLRLYPSDVEAVRKTRSEVVSKGITIPKGTPVILSPLLNGRDATFFQDPMVFNPDRFIPNGQSMPSRSVYFPYHDETKEKFGRFGEIAMKVLLAKMLLKLKIHFFPDQQLTETNLPTLRPTRGGIAVFNQRDNEKVFIYEKGNAQEE